MGYGAHWQSRSGGRTRDADFGGRASKGKVALGRCKNDGFHTQEREEGRSDYGVAKAKSGRGTGEEKV